MPTPFIPTTEDEATHKEMERISLDWCMVYNPTDTDFYIEWAARDGRPWKYLVPNKNKDIGFGPGKYETQRYLAIWYCEHMKDLILNTRGKDEGEKMLAARREKGQPDLTKFEEQKAIWEKTPKTSSDKELAALYPILFLGVTREFGMDYDESPQPYSVDQKTQSERALDELKNKKYTPEVSTSTAKTKTVKEPEAPMPSVEDLEGLMKNE